MVSGFHRAQHHSASLFLYLSFIHCLSLSFVSLFFVASHTQLSVYVHIPFVPVFSLPLALSLCSSFHPIHCFSICALPASFYLSLSLSHSLLPCLAPSLHPVPSRCRTTSVELIRYSRHIWTALTGINHEYF